jgi:SAM-dependent methyltransferase
MSFVETVIWHDIECGGYDADLPLWRELAATYPGPILDIGAGTGRVALDLAGQGHRVTALDRDAGLLAELARRAGSDRITTVEADARKFDLGQRFALILVPMQTVQLLETVAERAAFLRCAVAHLDADGRVAAALADPFDGFDAEHTEPPPPDVARHGGVTYSSQPVAIRREGGAMVIERLRRTLDSAGLRGSAPDTVRLADLPPARLEREALAAGLRADERRRVPETDEHVGSVVVLLHA